ncbi:MAG: hypothetical protein HUU20_16055 [Pirellulales bacterium]|nr:hypothetical protein [Pirellulales bacterium]
MTSIVPSPSGDNHEAATAERPQSHPALHNRILSDPGASGGQSSAPADTAPDPFSPEALRLSQDFASIGVKKVLTTVPCRKPNRHEFVRVRPGEDWRLETGVFEDKVNRETYLVRRDLWGELSGEVFPVCLFLSVNRQGDAFLWPCKLPGADGRSNAWNESALAAARLAESKWIRVAANMAGGMYDVFEAAGELAEPEWPELSFADLLKLCFKDRFIQTVDHPVIRALRGLA